MYSGIDVLRGMLGVPRDMLGVLRDICYVYSLRGMF